MGRKKSEWKPSYEWIELQRDIYKDLHESDIKYIKRLETDYKYWIPMCIILWIMLWLIISLMIGE